jgi:hypothetical protein
VSAAVADNEPESLFDTPGGRFRIIYRPRTPTRGGPCRILDGIANVELVHVYARALDATYERLGSRGLGWREPTFSGKDDRISVILSYKQYPQVRPSLNGRPWEIVLRTELFNALTPEEVRAFAEVEATHEVAHLFTALHRDPSDKRWLWFDEATAAYFQHEFNWHNPRP